jgi:hypothetical protein
MHEIYHNSGNVSIVVFHLKHDISEPGFRLPLQMEPTHLGPIDKYS